MYVTTNLPAPAPTGQVLPLRFVSEAAKAVDDFFLFNETPDAVQCLTTVFAHYIANADGPLGAETRAQRDAAHLDTVRCRTAVYFDILNLLVALGNAHSTHVVNIDEKEVANG